MERATKIYVYAPTVISYGGLALIQSIADAATGEHAVFVLSEKAKLPRPPANTVVCRGGVYNVFLVERSLKRQMDERSVLISLTNRPPLLRLPGYVVTVLMSAYAVETSTVVPTSPIRRLKSKIQILMNRHLRKNTDAFLARSKETFETTRRVTGWNTVYFPFMTASVDLPRSLDPPRPTREAATFFYPADAPPHKNHKTLFAAWQILTQKRVQAALVVTLSHEEASRIEPRYQEFGIKAAGFVSDERMTELFKTSDALIFPSLLESSPLPVIEARRFNLAIVASERNFVREQVDPEESFDPHSSQSIADAVLRFMGRSATQVVRPDAAGLLELVRSLAEGADPQQLSDPSA